MGWRSRVVGVGGVFTEKVVLKLGFEVRVGLFWSEKGKEHSKQRKQHEKRRGQKS